MDVFLARKIGAPGHEELGIAAIAEGLDEPVTTALVDQLGLTRSDLDALAARERERLNRRAARYRGEGVVADVEGRAVVVTDDGLATGSRPKQLCGHGRRRPRRLVLAEPVCAFDTAQRLRRIADDVICVYAPDTMYAVGMWYEDFAQTSDQEVVALLEKSRVATAGADPHLAVGHMRRLGSGRCGRGDLPLHRAGGQAVGFTLGASARPGVGGWESGSFVLGKLGSRPVEISGGDRDIGADRLALRT